MSLLQLSKEKLIDPTQLYKVVNGKNKKLRHGVLLTGRVKFDI